MSGVKVKMDDIKNALKEFKSEKVQRQVGEMVIEEIKKSLAAGLSPVKGVWRFENYSNPKRYPGDKKPALPVNLKLSGDMLDALEVFFKNGKMFIGIRDATEKEKAEKHNDGLDGMPKRHFLPTDPGDEFTVTIQQKIKDLYESILRDIIKKRR